LLVEERKTRKEKGRESPNAVLLSRDDKAFLLGAAAKAVERKEG
jgi:hypothetical protein